MSEWHILLVIIITIAAREKKSDAARAWIKEAGRMNHLMHSVP